MAKRAGSALHSSAKASASKKLAPAPTTAVSSNGGKSRLDRLVQLIDHCTAAKDIADGLGETFLAYMLAMAIQEARSDLRQSPL